MNFIKILFFILFIEISADECDFSEIETTTTTTTTSSTTTTIIQTTALLNLCQYITGLKLNSIAQAKLISIGNFNLSITSTDDCCIKCNLNPNCDYFFEVQHLGTFKSNCAIYHFTNRSSVFIKLLKNGDYYDKNSFSLRFTSGFTNRFFGY